MSGVSFMMFRWFYEKLIFPMGKRMFAISPDRIGEKSDPNLGLERWTKYDYFAGFKKETSQKNTKHHRCNNKTMNINWGFSLRLEISGKGCVYHNLPWVFNSYVLLRGGGRGELNIMVLDPVLVLCFWNVAHVFKKKIFTWRQLICHPVNLFASSSENFNPWIWSSYFLKLVLEINSLMKGIIKDQLRGGKWLDRPHSEPK